MKIINPSTGKVIDLKSANLRTGIIEATVQETKHSPVIPENLVVNFSDFDTAYIDIKIREAVLSNPSYADFVRLEDFNDWLAPEKENRIYATSEQVEWFAINANEFLQMINAPPRNPIFKINGGVEVYLNNIAPEVLPILENLGIVIETKPI